MSFPGCPVDSGTIDPDGIRRWVRAVALVVNRINTGKINAVIDVTLTPSSTSTVVTDARLTLAGAALFDPITASASAALPNLYAMEADRLNGEWTLTHASNAASDQSFRMVIIG